MKMTMKIAGDGNPSSFTAEARTPLQCLAEIEKHLGVNLTDDSAFDVTEAIKVMEDGKVYERRCFSMPEENYDLLLQK